MQDMDVLYCVCLKRLYFKRIRNLLARRLESTNTDKENNMRTRKRTIIELDPGDEIEVVMGGEPTHAKVILNHHLDAECPTLGIAITGSSLDLTEQGDTKMERHFTVVN